MSRILSHTEIDTALSCQAQWDFRYGDTLAGSSLREKAIAPLLSAGRAWGAAVAAWHVHAGDEDAGTIAIQALDEALDKDADRQREHGVHDQEAHDALRLELLQILAHHVQVADQVQMDEVTERELLVSLPSRSGRRKSSRYKLACYLDATESEYDGLWIDEFKLRGSLTDVKLITKSRQIRRYAWAYQEQYGVPVKGVYVNERLRQAPKPIRMVQGRKKSDPEKVPSHAKDQLCTLDAYLAACDEYGVEPVQETVEALRTRRWHQRVPVMFRPGELEEVGKELVSAAEMIRDLDGGRYPIRNAKRGNCNWCPFIDICESPDNDLVDALFTRKPPKRDLPARTEEEAPAS